MGGKESKFNWKFPLYGIIGAAMGLAFSKCFPILDATGNTTEIVFDSMCAIGGAALVLTLVYLAKYKGK